MSAAHSPTLTPDGQSPLGEDESCAATGLSPDPVFDDIALLAATLCDVAAAGIWVPGRNGWRSKASWGDDYLLSPRVESLSAAALEAPSQVLVSEDVSRDPRFRATAVRIDKSPLRFYAGVPLSGEDGRATGVLCVMDSRPRQLGQAQIAGLEALARQAQQLTALRIRVVEQRRLLRENEASSAQMELARAELEQRHHVLQRTAERDQLTGLLNRTALAQLRENPRAMQKLELAPYSLVLLDVDHFKLVNDRHGHLLGDRALRAVADAIAASVRLHDVAVRYGGEEFLVILPETGVTDAYEVAHRIRERVSASGLSFAMTVSAGIAAGDPARDRFEQVFERADQALYQAKAGGRDRVVVADDTPQHGS